MFQNKINISCNIIAGTKALDVLDAKLDFKNNVIKWDTIKTQMKTNAECFDLVNSHKLYTLFTIVVSDDEPSEIKDTSKHV